jgi:hypothetical protein
MKRLVLVVIGVLLIIGFVVGFVWKIVDVHRCQSRGGVIVFPLMRDQHCVMPSTEDEASFVSPNPRPSIRA